MFIDSHCHIDFQEFSEDRASVIAKARSLGVTKIVVPSVSQATWGRAQEICEQYRLELALGLHPVFIEDHQPHHLIELDEKCSSPNVKAVGEIGLDFFLKDLDRDKQLAYFSKQLIIANRHQKPVIIHCRKAHDECLRLIAEHKARGGIIHAFNGSLQQAYKYLEMGFLLGFGGTLTYPHSRKIRELAKSLPLTCIALETDAPDMTVSQHKGERNSPEYISLVAEALAELKGITIEEVAEVTTENVGKCLGNL